MSLTVLCSELIFVVWVRRKLINDPKVNVHVEEGTRQCTYNDVVHCHNQYCAGKTTVHIVCVAGLYVTVSSVKTLHIAQQSFDGTCMLPTKIHHTS
jgi:hypothetical protein